MSTFRIVLLAVAIEAAAVLVLVLLTAVLGPADPAATQAYAEQLGYWVGPLAGFVLCLGGGWLVARRLSEGQVRRGALLGAMVAAIDVAILVVGGATFQLIFVVSNVGRIVAGGLGGLLAGRSVLAGHSVLAGRGTPMRRSILPIASLLALLAAPGSAQIPAYDGPGPTAVRTYGDAPQQFGELRIPDGAGPFPVAVMIHGGCWLDRLGEGSITPAAAALTDAGIATWNVEYRRLGHDGGGWPGTFLDVGAGIDLLRELAAEYPLDLDRVVVAGHSSGAHLAVWAAGRTGLPPDSEIRGGQPLPVRAAVAIDGPMDLAAWSAAGSDVQICGGPVISDLMGGEAGAVPTRYAHASPVEMPPFEAAIFLNPSGMMLALDAPEPMVERARTTGERVSVVPVTNSNHFQLITPSHAAWSTVLETIQTALGGGAPEARP